MELHSWPEKRTRQGGLDAIWAEDSGGGVAPIEEEDGVDVLKDQHQGGREESQSRELQPQNVRCASTAPGGRRAGCLHMPQLILSEQLGTI